VSENATKSRLRGCDLHSPPALSLSLCGCGCSLCLSVSRACARSLSAFSLPPSLSVCLSVCLSLSLSLSVVRFTKIRFQLFKWNLEICILRFSTPCHNNTGSALSITPLLLLCPRQTLCAQHPPLLCCSTRPAPGTLTEAHTSRGVAFEAQLRMWGLVNKDSSKQESQCTGEQPDEGRVVTSRGHGSGRRRGACVWPHAQKVNSPPEMSVAQQAGGKGETEKGKQTAGQKKRTRTTSQAPTTQPASLAADSFCSLGHFP
jgi:hypothetical protein